MRWPYLGGHYMGMGKSRILCKMDERKQVMKKNHCFASVFFLLFLCFMAGQTDALTKYCIKDLGYLKDNNDKLSGWSINNQGLGTSIGVGDGVGDVHWNRVGDVHWNID